MTQSVMVIDDSSDVHDLLDVRLEPEDVLLHHAFSGAEGIQQCAEVRPDLILLDVDMPVLGGFEVCQSLKEDPRTSAIPVIFLTAAGEVSEKVRGFDLGAVDYITKPFQPAELRARVRAALATKRYHDLLATRAHIDGLTGLWNWTYFAQRMSDEISAVRRYGRTVSLVLLDIDHFKRVNDTYGHPFGDVVLQRVGEVLSTLMRATDAPCRQGGEEFALLLTETDLKGAERAAERVRDGIRALRLTQKGVDVAVRASFGVACTSSSAHHRDATAEWLMEQADQALYTAKHAGRDRIVVADPATGVEDDTLGLERPRPAGG